MSRPSLLTVDEVARGLRVDPSTVRRWVDAGKLEAVRLPSGRLRIPAAAVDALVVPARVDP